MKRIIILALLSLVGSLLSGCEVTVKVLQCEADVDCLGGEYCDIAASGDKFDNQCVAIGCLDDAECADNEFCFEGTCEVFGLSGCVDDSECADGEFCFEEACENICEDTEFFLRTANNPEVVCYPVSPCSNLTCDAGQICVPIKKQGAPADDAVCADITSDNSCEEFGVCCDGQDNTCSPADCFCDEACLQFGDCCDDYIATCF
jgi:hypothetical protein